MRQPYVYILASQPNGTLYTGVTSNLAQRLWQHGQPGAGFSQRYHVKMLVWLEAHNIMETAIAREKQIKGWSRAKKIALIESANPQWSDLTYSL